MLLTADTFELHCFQAPTGTKFFITAPLRSLAAAPLLRVVYELYADYVLKNPFYEGARCGAAYCSLCLQMPSFPLCSRSRSLSLSLRASRDAHPLRALRAKAGRSHTRRRALVEPRLLLLHNLHYMTRGRASLLRLRIGEI